MLKLAKVIEVYEKGLKVKVEDKDGSQYDARLLGCRYQEETKILEVLNIPNPGNIVLIGDAEGEKILFGVLG